MLILNAVPSTISRVAGWRSRDPQVTKVETVAAADMAFVTIGRKPLVLK